MVGGAYLATRWPGNVMKKKLVTCRRGAALCVEGLGENRGAANSGRGTDALRDHLAAKQHDAASGRNHVMRAYLRSTHSYAGLYQALAR